MLLAGASLWLFAGRAFGLPANALTFPPAAFSLEAPMMAEPAGGGQLTLLKDLTFEDPSLRKGDSTEGPGLPGLEAPGQLTFFKDVRLGRPPVSVSWSLAEPAPAVSVARDIAPARPGGGLRPWAAGGVMALAVGASLQNSMKEPSSLGYRFTSEGFFGRTTYAGGGDKAAHFVDYSIVYRLLDTTYRTIGYPGGPSRWMAAGTAFAAGLATEIGDGTSLFGFSPEDLLMDALGIASAMGLSHSGWDDAFGFRTGSGIPQQRSACCAADTYGRDYSGEIYTADVKIAGLARHLRFEPGPSRFFLFSMTYGTNGYRNAPPEMRQRLVGLEIGIHFSEILRTLRVPSEPLWGEILYLFFDTVRLPYTAIGVRYDLNHHQWFTPTAGRTEFPSASR